HHRYLTSFPTRRSSDFSIQLRAKAWAPAAAMRSSAAEISPPSRRSFAIRVAMNTGDLPELALIAGPTASGKSALALALAERTGGDRKSTRLNSSHGSIS